MNKLYFKNLLFLLCLLIFNSCVLEEDTIQFEKIEQEKKTFATFSQSSNIQGKSNKSTIDYASGFAILLQKHDSIHKTNISGLVNTTNIIKHKKNSRQNVVVESRDFYIETRLHSQIITESNGNKYVMFPLIRNNKVDKLFVGVLSKEDTYLSFYKINENHPLYEKNINLFKNAFSKKSSLQSKSGDGGFDCGFEEQANCELQEVVIIVSPNPIPWPSYPPSTGGPCVTYGDCGNPGGGNGSGNTTPCDQLNTNNENGNEILNGLDSDRVKEKVALLEKDVDTNENERGISIGINKDGKYYGTPIRTGKETAVDLGLSTINPNNTIVAALHTHTPNTMNSFSTGDFYILAEGNGMKTDFQYFFALASNKDLYLLSITDPEKFKNFLTNYPKNNYFDSTTNNWNKDSSIGKSYFDIRNKLIDSGLDVDSAHELANAYVLDKYDTGMTVSKKTPTSDGFKSIQTQEKDGDYSKTDDCLL